MAAEGEAKRRRVPVWLETLMLLAVALAVSALVKTFFVQMFFVPSGSMRPLFVNDDRILVEKVSYWDGEVERGDVVVFADPGGQWLGSAGDVPLNPVQTALSKVGLYPTGGHLVKRVIGVEGDRVKCCDKKGRVTVNGVPLEEDEYVEDGLRPSNREFDVTVPEGRLWVMGDNRSNSEDSRFHQDLDGQGTVPESAVVGKVWAVVWPLSRFETVDTPTTFGNPALLTSGER
ncbi:MAG: signal peptidase I [Actinomycetes bacterium]